MGVLHLNRLSSDSSQQHSGNNVLQKGSKDTQHKPLGTLTISSLFTIRPICSFPGIFLLIFLLPLVLPGNQLTSSPGSLTPNEKLSRDGHSIFFPPTLSPKERSSDSSSSSNADHVEPIKVDASMSPSSNHPQSFISFNKGVRSAREDTFTLDVSSKKPLIDPKVSWFSFTLGSSHQYVRFTLNKKPHGSLSSLTLSFPLNPPSLSSLSHPHSGHQIILFPNTSSPPN